MPIPVGVRAEVTADKTSISVLWEWSCQGVLDLVRVYNQPEGGSLMMYTVGNTTAITSATLPNLQCNTKYNIWVQASGLHNSRSLSKMVYLPARGMFMLYSLSYCYCIHSTVPPQPLPLLLRSLLSL